jgi:cell division protein FtsI/penicillin-binding protein 2
VSAIANNGKVLKPVISELGKKENIKKEIKYSKDNFKAIRRAMRETVLTGTTQSLNFDFVKIATKSGTAQIKNNTRVNS